MTITIILQNEEEIKQLSNKELLLAVKNLNMPTKSMSRFIKDKHHNSILDEVISRTKFLDEVITGFVPVQARFYCLEHDLKSHPTCQNPECDHIVEWRNGLHRFAPYCSMQCRDTDPMFQKKKEHGIFAKHGVSNCMKLDWVKDKVKKTNLDRLGVEYAAQSPQIQKKTRQTCLERHGVECVFQSEEFRKKSEETCELKYGVKHPCQNPDILEKQKQTFIDHYGTHPMKTKEGVEKVEKTMMERHGVRNAFQLESVREKLKESNISRYGVMWYMQSYEYHKTKKHKYKSDKYPGIMFDSRWEVKVYEFCRDNYIPVEYSPPISYSYNYNGETHTYHPDFLINANIYEVKGDNFFRFNDNTGKEEMYCPYRRPEWSDEYYDWECGLYEAKHQCMLRNNVIILRKKHITHLSKDLFL